MTDTFHANVWIFDEENITILFDTELTTIPRNPVNILA
jgi:hypothetical protein